MIYLIRHGQSVHNAEGRFQGGLDSPLTELGRAQARAVGETLAGLVDPQTPIVSSPLGRAIETAQIVKAAVGLSGPIQLDPRLAEITVGEWDGLTQAEIAAAYPGYKAGRTDWDWHFHAPGGESYAAFRTRLGAWLDEALALGLPMIAVSHGGCSRMLRGLAAGIEKDQFLRLSAPQDAIFRLRRGEVEQIACPGA